MFGGNKFKLVVIVLLGLILNLNAQSIIEQGFFEIDSQRIEKKYLMALAKANSAIGRIWVYDVFSKTDIRLSSTGTGFVINQGSEVQTNCHVYNPEYQIAYIDLKISSKHVWETLTNEKWDLKAKENIHSVQLLRPTQVRNVNNSNDFQDVCSFELAIDAGGKYGKHSLRKKFPNFLKAHKLKESKRNKQILIASIGHPFGIKKPKVTFGYFNFTNAINQHTEKVAPSWFLSTASTLTGMSGAPVMVFSDLGELIGFIGTNIGLSYAPKRVRAVYGFEILNGLDELNKRLYKDLRNLNTDNFSNNEFKKYLSNKYFDDDDTNSVFYDLMHEFTKQERVERLKNAQSKQASEIERRRLYYVAPLLTSNIDRADLERFVAGRLNDFKKRVDIHSDPMNFYQEFDKVDLDIFEKESFFQKYMFRLPMSFQIEIPISQ